MWESLLVLAATEHGEWRLGIGDPTPVGWFTVFAYLAVAIACGGTAMAERRAALRGEPARSTPWWVLCGLLLFLGINKQLDLQTWLGSTARNLSRAQGWYAERRFVQALFIAGLAVAGLVFLTALAWSIRGLWRRCGVALVGSVFLIVFVLARASSFHHVDVLLGSSVLGVRWNWILELGGIATVGLGTWLARRDRRRGAADPATRARSSDESPGARTYRYAGGIILPLDERRRGRGRRA